MVGIPHRLGTREYLACEIGEVELVVSGEKFNLTAGDVIVFRGDQKHSYANRSAKVAVAYSAIVLGPGRIH
jgi:quercetin dioxygenase-like cupin family protein